MGVVDAGVHAQPAKGRHLVDGVADQKNTPIAVVLGDVGADAPGVACDDLDWQIRYTHGGPDQANAPPGGSPRDARREPLVADVEAPVGGAVDREQAAASLGMLDPAPVGWPIGEPGTEVGTERDEDAVGQIGVPDHPDPQRLADAAAGTVGADQVGCSHATLPAAVAISQRRGDAVVVPDEADQLAPEAQVDRFALADGGAQGRLDHAPRAGAGRDRTERLRGAGAERCEPPFDLPPGDRLDAQHVPSKLGRQPRLADRLFGRALAQDLHRARVHQAGRRPR